MKNLFHKFIRWALATHGVIHAVEFAVNLYEHAWWSAALTAFAAFIMIAGALIDLDHHKALPKCQDDT